MESIDKNRAHSCGPIVIISMLCFAIVSFFTPVYAFAYNEETYTLRERGHYFYEMDEEEQAAYESILNGVARFQEVVQIADMDYWKLYDVIVKFRADYPEIFWLDASYSCEKIGDIVSSLHFYYVYNEEEVDEINSVIMDVISSVRARTVNMSQYDMALEVFKWVLDNVNYNHSTYNPINVEQAFLKGNAICGGFAKAYAVVAMGVGLDCDIIIGARSELSSVAHAWNKVYVDGEPMLVDCTWGDHYPADSDNRYFNAEEEWFYKNHTEVILH